MRRWWHRAPIRVRLTVWYSAALTLLLIVYATATYLAVRHEFHERLEEEARVETSGAPLNLEQRIEQLQAEQAEAPGRCSDASGFQRDEGHNGAETGRFTPPCLTGLLVIRLQPRPCRERSWSAQRCVWYALPRPPAVALTRSSFVSSSSRTGMSARSV